MQWIDVGDKEIPKDQEVLVIWKGRIGILYWDSDTDDRYCAMMPLEYDHILMFDEESIMKVQYWMPLPEPIFRCDKVNG